MHNSAGRNAKQAASFARTPQNDFGQRANVQTRDLEMGHRWKLSLPLHFWYHHCFHANRNRPHPPAPPLLLRSALLSQFLKNTRQVRQLYPLWHSEDCSFCIHCCCECRGTRIAKRASLWAFLSLHHQRAYWGL